MSLEQKENLLKLTEQWLALKHKGDLVWEQLFRLSYYVTGDLLIYFMSYVQLPLVSIYVIAMLCVIYIFIKEKMFAFINVLLVLSNILDIVPLVIQSPITTVFLLFAKTDVPIPSPWCNILIISNDSIYHIVQTISIILKILLAINRICGVYFPLQFHIWFSRKRCVVYTALAFVVGGGIGGMLNLTTRTIEERVHLDDVWGNGYLEAYSACFLDSSFVDRENANPVVVITKIAQIAVSIVFILILIACDIFLIVKLRQQQRKRNAIQTRSATTKAAENRINLLNRVCMWVLLVMVISALPHTILRSYSLYVLVHVGVKGGNSFDTTIQSHGVFEAITVILTTVVTPLDLFVFFGLSKKAKSRLRRICCVFTS